MLQKGKEEDAEVFVRNNTYQRDDLKMVSQMLEGHLKKVANITLERVPSQATELLGVELVNTEDSAGKDDTEESPPPIRWKMSRRNSIKKCLT